ncbi:oxygenase MpaB family protein [Nocardia sp. NPDC050712]|uniref:oxygenase MpaB family protein n=1 Tax=Nocardia sp. NPDC050712 TaxID=3155518 RepID=UPI0033CB7F91
MEAASTTGDVSIPSRFRADPDWARSSSAGFRKLVGPDPDPTQAELDTIVAGLTSSDPLGATLADAIAAREVTLKQFREVLAGGLRPDSPEPLRAFFTEVQARPDWVDDQLLVRGAELMRQAGTVMVDVLDTALVNGYRSSANTLLLNLTGGLSHRPLRRLGETLKWTVECVRAGGLDRDRQGWQLTVHVRLMHALINRHYARDAEWDFATYGMPINQADQGATLGLHCSYYLLGVRLLGMPITRGQSAAVMHLWRYIGWLLGVQDYWLPRDEADGRRKFYHLSVTAPGPDDNSRLLAAAFETARAEIHYPRFGKAMHRYHSAKTRSIFSVLIGRRGLREDLGLTASWPWYFLLRVPANLVLHGIIANLPGGRALMLARGERQLDIALSRLFPDGPAAIGQLRHGN